MKYPTILLLLIVLLLAGCGQKGPLYLPSDTTQQPSATNASDHDTAEQTTHDADAPEQP